MSSTCPDAEVAEPDGVEVLALAGVPNFAGVARLRLKGDGFEGDACKCGQRQVYRAFGSQPAGTEASSGHAKGFSGGGEHGLLLVGNGRDVGV